MNPEALFFQEVHDRMGTEEKRGKCMDLFDYMKEKTMENESPLASRMRPATLE